MLRQWGYPAVTTLGNQIKWGNANRSQAASDAIVTDERSLRSPQAYGTIVIPELTAQAIDPLPTGVRYHRQTQMQ